MVDMTNDVIRFEQLFSDRFTENDAAFMELKSKSLPNPVVIYPWRTMRKQWNKKWDYGRRNEDGRNQDRRGNNRNDERGGQNSYNRNRNRDGENSRDRSPHRRQDQSQDRNRDRPRDNRRSQNNRRDRYRESSPPPRNDEPFDYQAALKAYRER